MNYFKKVLMLFATFKKVLCVFSWLAVFLSSYSHFNKMNFCGISTKRFLWGIVVRGQGPFSTSPVLGLPPLLLQRSHFFSVTSQKLTWVRRAYCLFSRNSPPPVPPRATEVPHLKLSYTQMWTVKVILLSLQILCAFFEAVKILFSNNFSPDVFASTDNLWQNYWLNDMQKVVTF